MKHTKNLVRTALVAAIYVVLTLAIPGISYGPIQFRISEILTLLCFYNPFYIPAIVAGVFLSNLFSTVGPIDLLFGTAHTFISLYFMSKADKLWKASLYPALFSFIIAAQIVIVSMEPISFIATTLSIMASEFLIVTVIGVPSYKILEQNKIFKNYVLDYDPK